MKVSLMRGKEEIKIREDRRFQYKKEESNPLKSKLVGFDNSGLVNVAENVTSSLTEEVESLSEPEKVVIKSNFLEPDEKSKREKSSTYKQQSMLDALGVSDTEIGNVETVDTQNIVNNYNETMEESNPITITAEQLQNAMLGGNNHSDDLAEKIMKVDLKEDLETEKIQEDLNDKYADEYKEAQGGIEKICKSNKKDLSMY